MPEAQSQLRMSAWNRWSRPSSTGITRMLPSTPRVTNMACRCAMAAPLLINVAILMNGCATPTPAPQSSSPPAVTSFDGSYRTSISVVGSAREAEGTNWCISPGQPIVTVSAGQFSYTVPHPNAPGNPTPVFPATLAADGSFSGQINGGSISGRIAGKHMEGRIDGSGCIYTFSGDQI